MLQALMQQLGNNLNEIKSVVSCAFKQIQASHVVFGRACGAALTTPNILRKATAYDIAITLPDQSSASSASIIAYLRPNQILIQQLDNGVSEATAKHVACCAVIEC